jgi:hypothetical protein
MVALTSLALTLYLLAASNNNNNRRSSNERGKEGSRDNQGGRSRYGRSGKKSQGDRTSSNQDDEPREVLQVEPPPLTDPNGLRPTYFTCRHTYESTLMDEIQRAADTSTVQTSSPAPGLVRVEDPSKALPDLFDPVYALQTIPNAVVVTADSIKALSKAVYEGLLLNSDDEQLCQELREAPRGSLAIHGVVPGMCKGQPKPVMGIRAQKVAEELSGMLRKGYPAARKVVTDNNNNNNMNREGETSSSLKESNENERWILQVLLMTPDVAVASLTQCRHLGPGGSYWPNWHYPVGLAKVDIVGFMPSSAYRKLMEAFECMRIRPQVYNSRVYKSHAVDLGACPGGWTTVLRRLDCGVVAVDRSKLDPALMQDDMVEFVKGDAFTFVPNLSNNKDQPPTWMVSDVIAYPERVHELLNRWCGGEWASYMIVTMKFQGDQPAFSDLEHGINIAERHGYECRAKHFFNNKNEVTLMIQKKNMKEPPLTLEVGVLGSTMYPAILPRQC